MNQENKLPTAESQLRMIVANPSTNLSDSSIALLETLCRSYDLKDKKIASLREELEKLEAENKGFRRLYMDALDHRAKLRAENERLKKDAEEWKLYGKSWSEKAASRLGEVISLDEQNQKLKEALEDIASDMGNYLEIAKEALKGGLNE